VQSNLKADERVVVSGLQRVRPGAKVTPKPDPSSTTASTAAAVEAEAVKKEG
jgi:hypothetical protein